MASRHAGGSDETSREDWYGVGAWLSSQPELDGRYRFDPITRSWYEWTGTHWDDMPGGEGCPPRVADFLGQERYRLAGRMVQSGAGHLAKLILKEEQYYRNLNRGLATALRVAWGRPFPDYEQDEAARDRRQQEIAVPSGVVDLATGELSPHDSSVSDQRAVTSGDYRPQDYQHLREVLRRHLRPVFGDWAFDAFCHYLGLTISGRGQSYGSIILCIGGPGTGKGGTVKLIVRAMGGRGTVLSPRLLQATTTEIDSDRYYLMVRQPLVIVMDEMGVAALKINLQRLLSLTGDMSLARARMPYGVHSVTDTIPSVIWMPTVLSPVMGRGTGIERRMLVLPFKHRIPDSEKVARASYPQELLDAVITVAIREAQAVYQPGYVPPADDAGARLEVLEDMDPEMAALEDLDPASWDRKPILEALEHLRKAFPEMTRTGLGLKVNASAHWRKQRSTSGEHRGVTIIIRQRCDSPKCAECAGFGDQGSP